ncbi:MAG: 3-hydroxybutyryl-CoA dehydrogenase [Oligoflexia bacterium]|nr:3-hydroxybutyryl-CoA dehydrogenase [Oligoflexia bacterium]
MTLITSIGVVGSGQMGSGIAQVSAMSGFDCYLWDNNAAALNRAFESIKAQLQRLVEKEKITSKQAQEASAKLRKASSVQDFKNCQMVVEAIVENVEVKTRLFRELEPVVAPTTILASNTSSISITRLAAGVTRPDKVVGVHFMNPVPVMKLVEMIRGLQTSDETYNQSKAAVERMGKTTVLALDSAGFIVNRILCPMINEAIFLLQEGVKAEDIDAAMKLGTNQPMGPLTLADFVGLDTLLYILRILHAELGEDKYRPCPLLIKYVEAGWYGKKSGRGFYSYNS